MDFSLEDNMSFAKCVQDLYRVIRLLSWAAGMLCIAALFATVGYFHAGVKKLLDVARVSSMSLQL